MVTVRKIFILSITSFLTIFNFSDVKFSLNSNYHPAIAITLKPPYLTVVAQRYGSKTFVNKDSSKNPSSIGALIFGELVCTNSGIDFYFMGVKLTTIHGNNSFDKLKIHMPTFTYFQLIKIETSQCKSFRIKSG